MSSVMCIAETTKIEKLPTISEARNQENRKKYDETKEKINDLQKQIDDVKKGKDELESELYSYEQRNMFRDNLVHELSHDLEALKNYKSNADTQANNRRDERKKADNGIDRAWFSGVTEPTKDSRAALEYARIGGLGDKQLEGNKKLYSEHVQYSKTMNETILPKLSEDLKNRNNTLESLHLRGFRECGLSNFDCLASYSITKDQMTEQFIEKFVDAPYNSAYKMVLENNIPVTREELVAIALGNKISKEIADKINKNKEAFKDAINPQPKPEKEQIDLTKDQPESKKDPVDLKQ